MLKKNRAIKFILLVLTIIVSLQVNFVFAEPEYVIYNQDKWYQNWRKIEFGNNPVDFCFIIDDSSSTTISDPNNIRSQIVEKLLKQSSK